MSTTRPTDGHPHLTPTTLTTPLPGPDASADDLQIPLREAVVAGDYQRLDMIGTRLLAMGDRALGTDHTRLILAVAAARTAAPVTTPEQLPTYWQQLGPTITMLQIEIELHRQPGALAQSFTNALDYVTDAHTDAVQRLAEGTPSMSDQIARLSAVRDLPSASRLAWHGVDLNTDAPKLYGAAKLNAEIRRHHSRSQAYELGKQALALNPRWCATINSFAATCRELGRRDEATRWVARSMAITPNDYAARTMGKIGQDFAIPAFEKLADTILDLHGKKRSHRKRQKVAVKALTKAGFRAEVEAALDRPVTTTKDPFALRAAADGPLLTLGA